MTSHREHQTALAALAFALIATLASLVVMAIFLFPASPTGTVAPVYVGRIESIPLREPIYYREGGFFLVRLTEEEVIALVGTYSPYWEPRCTNSAEYKYLSATRGPKSIIWDTDATQFGLPGTFRAVCSSTRYAMDGSHVYGAGQPYLHRYPLTIDESGFVTVRPQAGEIIRNPPPLKKGQ